MKVRAIIQARMGSSRLRGKTLSPVLGIPLLKRVVDSVYTITNDIAIATSFMEEDDPIEAYSNNFLQCDCIRGDSEDVLSRYVNGAQNLNENDIVLRITADNIFYQKEVCEILLNEHKEGGFDYTGIQGLSHIVCEVLRAGVLQNCNLTELNSYEKEHVTPHFITNPNLFRTNIVSPNRFNLNSDLSSLLTIDTLEDRDRIEVILQEFKKNNMQFSIENLYNWLTNNKIKKTR